MNQDDIFKIENELKINLPQVYKKHLLDYPIPAYAGNSETMFWDDAEKIIELNQLLRTDEKFRDAWPLRFYALGQDSGGCSDAIDLEDEEFGVFWFDRQHINVKPDERSEEKIESWIKRQIFDYTHNLKLDGIDPNGTPAERERIEKENSKGGCLGLIILIIIGFLVIVSLKLTI